MNHGNFQKKKWKKIELSGATEVDKLVQEFRRGVLGVCASQLMRQGDVNIGPDNEMADRRTTGRGGAAALHTRG